MGNCNARCCTGCIGLGVAPLQVNDGSNRNSESDNEAQHGGRQDEREIMELRVVDPYPPRTRPKPRGKFTHYPAHMNREAGSILYRKESLNGNEFYNNWHLGEIISLFVKEMSSQCGVCQTAMANGNQDRLCCRVCAITLHKECAEKLELKQPPLYSLGSECPNTGDSMDAKQPDIAGLDEESHWRKCMENVSMNIPAEDILSDNVDSTQKGQLIMDNCPPDSCHIEDVCNGDNLNKVIEKGDASDRIKPSKPLPRVKPLELGNFALNKVNNNENFDIIYSCRNCRDTKSILTNKDRKEHIDILTKLNMQDCTEITKEDFCNYARQVKRNEAIFTGRSTHLGDQMNKEVFEALANGSDTIPLDLFNIFIINRKITLMSNEELLKLLSPLEMSHCRELYDYTYVYGMPQPEESSSARMRWYVRLAAMRNVRRRENKQPLQRNADTPCHLVWWKFLADEAVNMVISRCSCFAPEVVVVAQVDAGQDCKSAYKDDVEI